MSVCPVARFLPTVPSKRCRYSLFCSRSSATALAFAQGARLGEILLDPWSPGTFDIHQIQTGRGNAAFPDFSRRDYSSRRRRLGPESTGPGAWSCPARFLAHHTGQWIAQYIQGLQPSRACASLDYAVLVTHYHDDHIGALDTVAGLIPIRRLFTVVVRSPRPRPAPSSNAIANSAPHIGLECRDHSPRPRRSDRRPKLRRL